MRPVPCRRRLLWAAVVACASVAGAAAPAKADKIRPALEIEGYLDPRQHLYARYTQFLNPSVSTGWLALNYTRKWPQGDVRFLWLIRGSSMHDSEWWTGPELWPTWNITKEAALSAEIRYGIGIGDTLPQFQFFPTATYTFDKRYIVGVAATHTEHFGQNVPNPWFLGPLLGYQFNKQSKLQLELLQGVEDVPKTRLILDYVF